MWFSENTLCPVNVVMIVIELAYIIVCNVIFHIFPLW